MNLSSREEAPHVVDLGSFFSANEIEVIAALMYPMRLGKGSVYKQAVGTLIDKVEAYYNDYDRSRIAHETFALEVRILDDLGNYLETVPFGTFEFEV